MHEALPQHPRALCTLPFDLHLLLIVLNLPRKDSSTNKPEQDLASNPSEESESSSEGSNSVHGEAKYPNMELATEFLLGGSPFKQYKTNIRNFLRLDSEMWSPDTLQEHIVKGDITPVAKILENHFEDVAQLDFDWLHELLDIGCSFEEMARLLIDGENASPWILLDHPISVQATYVHVQIPFEII